MNLPDPDSNAWRAHLDEAFAKHIGTLPVPKDPDELPWDEEDCDAD